MTFPLSLRLTSQKPFFLTVDLTTVHVGARSKCRSLRCLSFSVDVGSFEKLKRGDESFSNVERSLLRGKRDRVFGSASLPQHDKERILFERKNLHEYLGKEAERALQGEVQLRKGLSEAEVEMDRKSWERRNSDIALFETNQQQESQIRRRKKINLQ